MLPSYAHALVIVSMVADAAGSKADNLAACAADMRACAERCFDQRDDEQCAALARVLAPACSGGHTRKSGAACYSLSILYRDGRGVVQSPVDQVALAEKACDLGEGLGCNDFGASVAVGRGVERSDRRALEAWRRGCTLGDGMSCMNLGNRYRNGRAVERDVPRAIELLTRGCDLEDAQACSSAGSIFAEGDGTLKDPNKARTFFEKGCRLGNSYACSKVRPEAVNVSAAQERMNMEADCNDGLGVGCGNLAHRYLEGRGAEKNRARAVELFEKACALGFPPSCEQLGTMELAGRHALRKARAADYFKRACDRSWPAGCERLGSLLWANHHSEDDVAAAAAWEQACAAGLPKSCQHLADALARGKRITPDRPKAQALSDRACELGLKEACRPGQTRSE
jgi:uncharacterized protein